MFKDLCPTHLILKPIFFKKITKSFTSGSEAQFLNLVFPLAKHEAENYYEAKLGDGITMNSTRRMPRSKSLNKYIGVLCLYNPFQ